MSTAAPCGRLKIATGHQRFAMKKRSASSTHCQPSVSYWGSVSVPITCGLLTCGPAQTSTPRVSIGPGHGLRMRMLHAAGAPNVPADAFWALASTPTAAKPASRKSMRRDALFGAPNTFVPQFTVAVMVYLLGRRADDGFEEPSGGR